MHCSFGSICKNDAQYCCQFANDYKLLFNPGKTQLAQFSLPCSSPNPPISPTFLFSGQSLKLDDRACHLGHILSSDLSDTDDILWIQTDMCRRANCLLSTFYAANPAVKTLLFHSFCLSMALRYGDCHLPVYFHFIKKKKNFMSHRQGIHVNSKLLIQDMIPNK